MAEESYPFDTAGVGTPVLEDQWSRMARGWEDSGVYADPGIGTGLAVSANSSGMQVFVAAGEAFVRGHHYRNTAPITVTIPANATGSPRLDQIILRLDPSANSIVAARLAGTTTAAALTQTDAGIYELPLGLVTVPNGAATIAASAVLDKRLFAGLNVRPCRVVADLINPRIGQAAWETSSNLLQVWDGSAWQAWPTGGVGGRTFFGNWPELGAGGTVEYLSRVVVSAQAVVPGPKMRRCRIRARLVSVSTNVAAARAQHELRAWTTPGAAYQNGTLLDVDIVSNYGVGGRDVNSFMAATFDVPVGATVITAWIDGIADAGSDSLLAFGGSCSFTFTS